MDLPKVGDLLGWYPASTPKNFNDLSLVVEVTERMVKLLVLWSPHESNMEGRIDFCHISRAKRHLKTGNWKIMED